MSDDDLDFHGGDDGGRLDSPGRSIASRLHHHRLMTGIISSSQKKSASSPPRLSSSLSSQSQSPVAKKNGFSSRSPTRNKSILSSSARSPGGKNSVASGASTQGSSSRASSSSHSTSKGSNSTTYSRSLSLLLLSDSTTTQQSSSSNSRLSNGSTISSRDTTNDSLLSKKAATTHTTMVAAAPAATSNNSNKANKKKKHTLFPNSVLLGRTKNQRLRQQQRLLQKEAPSPYSAASSSSSHASRPQRYSVRFFSQNDDDDGEADCSPAASSTKSEGSRMSSGERKQSPSTKRPLTTTAATTTTTKRRIISVATGNKKKRRLQQEAGWLEAMTRDSGLLSPVPEDAVKTTTSTMAVTATMSTKQAKKLDVYAMQDAGNYQLLRDECAFLCGAIRSGGQQALQAASDLALMLSSRGNRRALFANDETLQAVLNIFAESTTKTQDGRQQQQPQQQSTAAVSLPSTVGRATKASRLRQQQASSQLSSPTAAIPKSIGGDRTLREAIGMCMHFVSIDCTLSENAASFGTTGASKAARRIRRAVLHDTDCLHGILHCLLADDLTHRLRGIVPVRDVQFSEGASSATSTPTKGGLPDTPESHSSTCSLDPTVAGRSRRLKHRSLNKIKEKGDDDDQLSFPTNTPKKADDEISSVASSSAESWMIKTRDHLDQVTARILGQETCNTPTHTCGVEEGHDLIARLPYLAINRVVSGRCEGNERSCLDDDRGQDEKGSENEDYNPLLATNELLSEQGALPLLSQALAGTVTAVAHQVKQTNPCEGCLSCLEKRVSKIVSLVDGASLLSKLNRQQLCEEGFIFDVKGYLVVVLASTLKTLLEGDGQHDIFHGVWLEITTDILRMLTSLTHENNIAAQELEAVVCADTGEHCLDVLANLLHAAVRKRKLADADSKMLYDSAIYCMNIFANAIESGGSCRLLAEMKIRGYDNETNLSFLTWLTRWLVGETFTFRDAITESTFGASPSKHTERKLAAHEDEKLVTAGNGFVLLSCLLVDENKDSEAGETFSAYRTIMEELPGDDRQAKMTFLKNTLKAFMNFYHYSVGDLSVAIVAPVKALLKRLDSIQESQREQGAPG